MLKARSDKQQPQGLSKGLHIRRNDCEANSTAPIPCLRKLKTFKNGSCTPQSDEDSLQGCIAAWMMLRSLCILKVANGRATSAPAKPKRRARVKAMSCTESLVYTYTTCHHLITQTTPTTRVASVQGLRCNALNTAAVQREASGKAVPLAMCRMCQAENENTTPCTLYLSGSKKRIWEAEASPCASFPGSRDCNRWNRVIVTATDEA